jgi:NAD(P)-dependent dehydrogenase (short-subunit alcohol dehydrogenase family)
MGEFSGLTAVVTGGVGGIGAAVAAALRDAGAAVTATGYNQAELDARADLPELQGVERAVLNVGDADAVEAFAKRFERADIQVNCAARPTADQPPSRRTHSPTCSTSICRGRCGPAALFTRSSRAATA